ncbi:unnamed protein product [Cladocopium goreaui]|uniref:Uncharacterized protein n=1 Tax=Cladocopium goreaui TaxID=2562237 RepID=A0A9P1G8J5_9DINO|nr:unnamed protein product [Cladocopium goreaui]
MRRPLLASRLQRGFVTLINWCKTSSMPRTPTSPCSSITTNSAQRSRSWKRRSQSTRKSAPRGWRVFGAKKRRCRRCLFFFWVKHGETAKVYTVMKNILILGM